MEKVAETVAKTEIPNIKIESTQHLILKYPQNSYFETNCSSEDVKKCLKSAQNAIFGLTFSPKNYPRAFSNPSNPVTQSNPNGNSLPNLATLISSNLGVGWGWGGCNGLTLYKKLDLDLSLQC